MSIKIRSRTETSGVIIVEEEEEGNSAERGDEIYKKAKTYSTVGGSLKEETNYARMWYVLKVC